LCACINISQPALAAKEKGNHHYKKKEFNEALAAYTEAIALEPTNITFLNNRAAVHLMMKNYDKCIQDCKDAIKIGRENKADFELIAKTFDRMGNCYQKQKMWSEAMKCWEDANMENYTKATDRKIKQAKLEAKKTSRRRLHQSREGR